MSLYSIMNSLLNQSHNKYSKNTIYIKSCEESVFIYFLLTPKDSLRVHNLTLHTSGMIWKLDRIYQIRSCHRMPISIETRNGQQ
jgi:hypothetical protein